uniref:VTT domain-containing protein n=1 Tax=Archaeoglobus fulgidus TaxID=2234 RepID=A0A7J2TKC2_ARCFL
MLEELFTKLFEFRHPGIFLISFISNSIPFVGIPYLNFLVIISPFLKLEEMVIIALISAIGASLGKIVIYFIGTGLRATLSEKTKENLYFFEKIFKKWGFFAIFLFAASPLPDDVLYIPLGIARYKLSHFFLAVFLGKTVVTFLAISMGKVASDAIDMLLGNNLLSFAVFFALTTLFTIAVIKIDWRELFERYSMGRVK